MNARDTNDHDLGAYLKSIKQYWIPASAIFITTITLAGLSTLLLTPSYRAEGKMRFKVDRTSLLEGVEPDSNALTPLVSTQNPLNTEIEVLYSKPLLKRVISSLELMDSEGETLTSTALSKQLSIDIIGGTDVLRISHESEDPQESTLIVNSLMDAYLRNTLQARRLEANAARNFIADQLPQSEKSVRDAENAVSSFKERNKIIDIESESESAVAEIARLDREINVTRVSYDEAVARASELNNQVGLNSQDAATISNFSQSSEVKEVLRELQSVERQLVTARELYQEEYPDVVNLKSQRDALKSLLFQSQQAFQNQSDVPTAQVEVGNPQQSSINDFLAADVDRKALAIRLESLIQRRAYYDTRVKSLPKWRQTLRELERKLRAAQSTYEFLLKKRQDLQVAENSNAQNAEIIEPAIVPSSGTELKKKVMIVAFGVLLGAFLATASIPVLSLRKRLSKSPNQLATLLDCPVWSVIPRLESQNNQGERDPSAFLPIMNEMHRMIRNHPEQLLETGHSLKVLAVTSSEAREGRSTIAANLASAMSQVGSKVLLIDADTSNPSQQDIFELKGSLGLSDVMHDLDIRFDEIKMVINPVMNNLDVMTSGTQSTNTIHSFNSEHLGQLLQYCSLNYDFVILDAPPLLGSSSTSIIGKLVDGLLLVTWPAMITTETSSAVKELVSSSGLNVVGIVVNGCKNSEMHALKKASRTRFSKPKDELSNQLTP